MLLAEGGRKEGSARLVAASSSLLSGGGGGGRDGGVVARPLLVHRCSPLMRPGWHWSMLVVGSLRELGANGTIKEGMGPWLVVQESACWSHPRKSLQFCSASSRVGFPAAIVAFRRIAREAGRVCVGVCVHARAWMRKTAEGDCTRFALHPSVCAAAAAPDPAPPSPRAGAGTGAMAPKRRRASGAGGEEVAPSASPHVERRSRSRWGGPCCECVGGSAWAHARITGGRVVALGTVQVATLAAHGGPRRSRKRSPRSGRLCSAWGRDRHSG